MRVLLAVLLLAPLAGGQFADAPEDASAVHKPVQVILDQLPRVMDLAIREAEADGTPHDAEELIASMEAFFAGFEGRSPWPEGTIAAASGARESFATVGAILDAAADIPPAVGVLSRVDAACVAYGATTDAQAVEWWLDAGGATRDLDALRGSLDALESQLPATLDAGPVRESVQILDVWLRAKAAGVEFCLEEVFVELDLEIPERVITKAAEGNLTGVEPYLELRVPEAVALGEQLVVTGRVVGPRDAPVRISSALGAAEVSLGAYGSFSWSVEVPPDAPLGALRLDAVAGNLTASAFTNITKAPVHLRIVAPGTVLPGETFTVRAFATSRVPVDAPLMLAGESGPSGLEVEMAAPESGSLRVEATHPGGPRHLPARAVHTVTVHVPVATAGDGLWDMLEKGIWYGPSRGTGVGIGPDRPGVPTAGMLGLAAVLIAFIVLDLYLSGRKREPEILPLPAPPAVAWPRAFVAAFAHLVSWLVNAGLAPRGATAREAAKRVEGMLPLARDFERVRYGEQPMPAPLAARGRELARRFWKRLGGA